MANQGEPEPRKLPRGTCATCHEEVALRNGGVTREHRKGGADGPVCQGSGHLALPAGETIPAGEELPAVPLEPDRDTEAEVARVVGVAFMVAEDVEEVAHELIESCEELRWLGGPDGPRIAYLHKLKGQVKSDRHTLAKALKAPEPWGTLAGLDAVVWVHRGTWYQLADSGKRALVHHELMHLDQDEETAELVMRPHDLEEFAGTVRRFGAWEPQISRMAEQLRLFNEDGPPSSKRRRRTG